MELNDLLKTLQSLNNNQNTNNEQTKPLNNVDFSNNYFKSQYPVEPINTNNFNNHSKTDTNNNYYQTTANQSGTLSQSYISPNVNNYNNIKTEEKNNINNQFNNNSMGNLLNLTNNNNLINILQNILPLLSSNNNILKNLFANLNKKSTIQSTEKEDKNDTYEIDNLIKIDDT